MKKQGKTFMLICFLFLLFLVVASGNKREKIFTYNINSVKSIEAVHIVSKYNPKEKQLIPKLYDTFKEAIENGANFPVSFIGTMTGYGPDCAGCSGTTGCAPRQNVTNGNIYFNDNDYGNVRIVATDREIPCGSIVRISNYQKEPIMAIALDRGGAIKGNIMDLLEASEQEAKKVGRQRNIQFDIIRWGW